ncbi:MAG: DUF1800 domain-containing protein [Pyrinomonadaceae bacterium]
MTTTELYTKYPNPGMLLKRLRSRGELSIDLEALRNQAPDASDEKSAASTQTPSQETAGVKSKKDSNSTRRDYRAAIRDYYAANDLLPPQRITAELQASRVLRAVYSERQLHEVMVDFWTNHFNVYANKGADRWLLVSYDRDTIRPNTLGSFSDLLLATAQSPAMLFYLDNFQSVSPKAQSNQGAARRRKMLQRRRARQAKGADDSGEIMQPQAANAPPAQKRTRGINENYARELMELHTLGVDGGYTQKDIQEVARCFTGWTITNPRGSGAAAMAGEAGKFFYNSRLHDDGEKIVLGHKIPAGGGLKDGIMVLDILARHPATAKFIATKLSRRFVTDNPSAALVDRVAAAYTKSNGDITATLRAVFSSPEFNSTSAYRAKIKTPFELTVSAIRALGAETSGNPAIHQWIAKMGEPLYMYQAPTGYPDTADSWVNTGALLERLNFALALSANAIKGTRVDLSRFAGGAASLNSASEKVKLIDRFVEEVLQGEVSPQTRATLINQLSKSTVESQNASNAAQIAGLVLGTPEFQRQ